MPDLGVVYIHLSTGGTSVRAILGYEVEPDGRVSQIQLSDRILEVGEGGCDLPETLEFVFPNQEGGSS